jgi:siroheme decarboxylase
VDTARARSAGTPDELALLNDWQQDFPLVTEPFAAIAAYGGTTPAQVLEVYRHALQRGAISRIGGVWAAGAGGAALLCALAVPPHRLPEVAARVNALPGVNHNYEREHRYNLWFVLTGRDAALLHRQLDALQAQTGLVALRLPMQRVYRIGLGFDLMGGGAAGHHRTLPERSAAAVAPADFALAAQVEGGLPLVDAPYAEWARQLGCSEAEVLGTLRRWLAQGSLRRFGVIVRHHEFGFVCNAMTVFDVADVEVDGCGEALARQPGVSLCYRRARAPGWPYNLYCMVHGRERAAVRDRIEQAAAAAGLTRCASEVLFSRRRFKQQGGSYFRSAEQEAGYAHA